MKHKTLYQLLATLTLIISMLAFAAPAPQIARVRQPFNAPAPEYIDLTSGGEPASGDGFNVLPFLVTVAIIVPLFTSGSYLFQSLVQEKDNRIMEMLLSLSGKKLIQNIKS